MNLSIWRKLAFDRRQNPRSGSGFEPPEVDLALTLESQISRCLGMLRNQDPNVYFHAARRLDKIWDSGDKTANKGERVRIVRGLEGVLGDKDPEMRRRGVRALGVMESTAGGSKDKTGLADFAVAWARYALLNDKDESVRCAAAWSLGILGKVHFEAEAPLVVALNDKSERVRHEAARSLERVGTEKLTLRQALKTRYYAGRATRAEQLLAFLFV